MIRTLNPATGVVERTFSAATDGDIDAALARAERAFRDGRSNSFSERAAVLLAAAGLLEERVAEYALIITTEMGRPLSASAAEVLKCARALRFYAENAETFMAEQPADAAAVGAARASVRWEPIGAVLAVMPWNYPLWQVVRFAAPALMAGNVCVLKHASNVPQSALLLASLFLEAGAPEGAFETLLVGSDRVADLIRDPRIAAVTLTGSEGAGRQVAATAGSVIKKSLLELGGSDPFIVMPSADLTAAVQAAVTSRIQNAGQSCISAKRFIVHEEIADDFTAQFVAQMADVPYGDPVNPANRMGPLATEQGRAELHELVEDSAALGARVECGGYIPEGAGWFYPPTVLTGVDPSMRAHREELFGPVATVYSVPTAQAAIELANDTDFGLSSSVWTAEESEQAGFVGGLRAGAVFVNGFTVSHPELPFGGIRNSGYGRELSFMGLQEFCSAKTVWVA